MEESSRSNGGEVRELLLWFWPFRERFYYIAFYHTHENQLHMDLASHHYFRPWSFNAFDTVVATSILENIGHKNVIIITWHEYSKKEHVWFHNRCEAKFRLAKLDALGGK
jgi:hypothetical protein